MFVNMPVNVTIEVNISQVLVSRLNGIEYLFAWLYYNYNFYNYRDIVEVARRNGTIKATCLNNNFIKQAIRYLFP